MKTQIVAIGNSQGIRIPKKLLEQSKLSGEVELELKDEGIFIRPVRKPREGWTESFREMAANGDDVLLDGDLIGQTSFDENEWQW